MTFQRDRLFYNVLTLIVSDTLKDPLQKHETFEEVEEPLILHTGLWDDSRSFSVDRKMSQGVTSLGCSTIKRSRTRQPYPTSTTRNGGKEEVNGLTGGPPLKKGTDEDLKVRKMIN